MNRGTDLSEQSIAPPHRGGGSRRQKPGNISSFGACFRELIRNPGSVGAVIPSSDQLARCMASFVPPSASGLVVELGPGTVVVTSALLDRRIPPDQIVEIELSENMTHLLN